MLIPSLFVKCATCVLPAFLGSVAVTPVSTVADIAVIKSASTVGMVKSLVDASREYRFDDRSILTFGCSFSTLVVSNWFVDERLKSISGVIVNTGLSMWKDSVYLGGSLSKTTRFLFVFRDVISIIPSVYRPGMRFLDKAVLVFMFQIPCTLFTGLAMDLHIFKNCKSPGMRRTRIKRSFCTSLTIRFLKSIFGNTLACQINHGVLNGLVA